MLRQLVCLHWVCQGHSPDVVPDTAAWPRVLVLTGGFTVKVHIHWPWWWRKSCRVSTFPQPGGTVFVFVWGLAANAVCAIAYSNMIANSGQSLLEVQVCAHYSITWG